MAKRKLANDEQKSARRNLGLGPEIPKIGALDTGRGAFIGIFDAICCVLIAKRPIADAMVFKDRRFSAGCVTVAAVHCLPRSGRITRRRRRPSRGSLLTAWRIARFATAMLTAALTGCTLGPDFVRPDPRLPAGSYEGETATVDSWLQQPPDPNWWAVFRDPILTDLERRVAGENLDVQTATIRLAESRFQRGVTAAALFPTVNGDAQYQRELYSVNGPFLSPSGPFGPLGSAIDRLLQNAGQPPLPRTPTAFNEFYTGFDASWELDLWGRVRRQVEAADAQVDQAAEQRRDALVSSLAELARDYIQLRGTQMQIRIAVEYVKVAEDVLTRAQERAVKGVGPGLDAEYAAAQVENIRAQIPTLEQQASQYINAVSLLLNQAPGALSAALGRPKLVPLAPPSVPVGVPSALARRRPDIRAAEALLHAATADIGVAVASFYPTLELNGTVGLDAVNFVQLWQSNSLQYMAGPSLKMPIFAGGRLKNMLELSKAQQQEAATQYQKTVMRAWYEVVNALIAYRLEQQRRVRLRLEIEHTRLALSLARERYSDGVGDFLTVLDAERTLLQAEQQYATSTTNVSLNLVQLFKALGGGWEPIFPNSPDAKTVASP
jgi:NodT family efflux transporter outer membrane factor (OMF) lipoprotein